MNLIIQYIIECMSAFKIFTGKPIGERPLGRPRHR
jgi:hypothetical protein